MPSGATPHTVSSGGTYVHPGKQKNNNVKINVFLGQSLSGRTPEKATLRFNSASLPFLLLFVRSGGSRGNDAWETQATHALGQRGLFAYFEAKNKEMREKRTNEPENDEKEPVLLDGRVRERQREEGGEGSPFRGQRPLLFFHLGCWISAASSPATAGPPLLCYIQSRAPCQRNRLSCAHLEASRLSMRKTSVTRHEQ